MTTPIEPVHDETFHYAPVQCVSFALPAAHRAPLDAVLQPLRDNPNTGVPLLPQDYLALRLQRSESPMRDAVVEVVRDAIASGDRQTLSFVTWMLQYPAPPLNRAAAERFAHWLRATAAQEDATPVGRTLLDALDAYTRELATLEDAVRLDAPWNQIQIFETDPEDHDGASLLLELATVVSPALEDVHFSAPDPSRDPPPQNASEAETFDAFAGAMRCSAPVQRYADAMVDVPAAVGLTNWLLRERGNDVRLLLLQGGANDGEVAVGPAATVHAAVEAGVVVPDRSFIDRVNEGQRRQAERASSSEL